MSLAPYAMKDSESRGRRFPEAPHPYRSEYQRDRDRVIHTKAFRRLEKKTQVFGPDYSDHFRNRLTHTIEVSQIGRTISQALQLNSDLCEVLALSHDIGHPPFSHEGETVLNRIMKSHGQGFEHNLHALRIVEDFEQKYAGFRGLNLTFEVREGIVKHSRDYEPESDIYIDIRDYRLEERPPLEAQLIDLADEIAYSAADLDDGYDSGLLEVEQLREQLGFFRVFWREAEGSYPQAEEKLLVSEVVRKIINHLVSQLINQTRANLKGLQIDRVSRVRQLPRRLVEYDSETRELNAELKRFLRREMYEHPFLQESLRAVRRQLETLFDYYFSRPERLPGSHRCRVHDLGPARVVCDYIAGMTDTYAMAKHSEIIGPRVI
jgi:dGTPase